MLLSEGRASRIPGKCLSGLEVSMEGLHIPADVLMRKILPSLVVNGEWMDDSLPTEHHPPLAHAIFYLRNGIFL